MGIGLEVLVFAEVYICDLRKPARNLFVMDWLYELALMPSNLTDLGINLAGFLSATRCSKNLSILTVNIEHIIILGI